jgi:hypothetical protein
LDLQQDFSGDKNNYLAPLQQQSLENENEILKSQLELRNQQLQKTEEKLNKKRQYIKEMA